MKATDGFTLLEVLIAISIMVIGVGTVLMIESNSIDATDKARKVTAAAMLAKRSMLESEMLFEGKPFADLKPSETGTYAAPYEDFQWTRAVKEIELPNITPSGGENAGEDANQNTMAQMVTGFLSKGMREITITVRWPRGKGFQEMSVTQYWVDLNHELQAPQ